MLNATLGEKVFRKGVKEYLNKYKGNNTEKEDLWNSFSQVQASPCMSELLNINYASFTTLSLLFQVTKPSIDVAQMMNTWTVEKGFPLVTVSRTGNQVKVTQDHFLLNPGNTTEHRYFVKWFWPGVLFARSSVTLQP